MSRLLNVLTVLGKLLFKSNLLQLLLLPCKINFYFTCYKNSKVTCYNSNYFSKVTKLLTCYQCLVVTNYM